MYIHTYPHIYIYVYIYMYTYIYIHIHTQEPLERPACAGRASEYQTFSVCQSRGKEILAVFLGISGYVYIYQAYNSIS